MMRTISADSHVVEAKEVYLGLADRFGDDAPRVMHENTERDAIIIPNAGNRGIRRRMAFAGLRTRASANAIRRHARKPEVDDISTPEVKEILAKGYAGMRAGVRDGAARRQDQDEDGVALAEKPPYSIHLQGIDNTFLADLYEHHALFLCQLPPVAPEGAAQVVVLLFSVDQLLR